MRISVGAKLLGGFEFVMLMAIALGVFGMSNLAAMNELATQIYNRDLIGLHDIAATRAAFDSYRLASALAVSAPDQTELNLQLSRRREAEAAFGQGLAAIESAAADTADGRALSGQLSAAWRLYRSASDQVLAANNGAANRADTPKIGQLTVREREDAVNGLLGQLSDWRGRIATEQARQGALNYERVRNVTAGLIVATLVVGVGIALWLARTIGQGVRATAQTAELIAAGDLTRSVRIRSRDEVGALGEAFNRMVGALRELTGEVREGVQSLSAATSEIVASVAQQGASTSQQAAAVSETTATVDEVRVTAQQSSHKAQNVAAMARHAAEIAAQGLGTVEKSMAGMQDLRSRVEAIADQILALSEQTQQVGEIIASVEDLADQSNLLAVNAAIEASRAGEQGRGFAVVAQEVRSLAERSKAATVQVRTMLTDIQRATNAAVLATEQGTRGADEGARLVEQAGVAIRQLDETIRHSAEAAQQIAASVGQQGAGMDQIAVAMASINQSTLETDAGTRQLQKAAESMNELAQRLSGLLGRYKLDRAA
jgi:methyl-accepting chemotaxis protein